MAEPAPLGVDRAASAVLRELQKVQSGQTGGTAIYPAQLARRDERGSNRADWLVFRRRRVLSRGRSRRWILRGCRRSGGASALRHRRLLRLRHLLRAFVSNNDIALLIEGCLIVDVLQSIGPSLPRRLTAAGLVELLAIA